MDVVLTFFRLSKAITKAIIRLDGKCKLYEYLWCYALDEYGVFDAVPGVFDD